MRLRLVIVSRILDHVSQVRCFHSEIRMPGYSEAAHGIEMGSIVPCIDANPDIAGIGVRLSIYVQAFHLLVPLFTFIFLSNGKLADRERRVMCTTLDPLLLASLALLISAFIQAARNNLSFLHALIAVRLSWINNIGSISYIATLFIMEERDFSRLLKLATFRGSTRTRLTLELTSINMTLTCIMDLWAWSKVQKVDSYSECTARVLLSFFGMRRSVEQARAPYKLFYFFLVVPGVNLLAASGVLAFATMVPVAFARILAIYIRSAWTNIQNRLHPQRQPSSVVFQLPPELGFGPEGILLQKPESVVRWHVGSKTLRRYFNHTWATSLVCVATAIQSVLIMDAEFMIQANKPIIRFSQEMYRWSLGQTLAVLLVAIPLVETARRTWQWYMGGQPTPGFREGLEKRLFRNPSCKKHSKSYRDYSSGYKRRNSV